MDNLICMHFGRDVSRAVRALMLTESMRLGYALLRTEVLPDGSAVIEVGQQQQEEGAGES